MTDTQMLITVILAVAGTVTTRFLPYALFSEGRPVPAVVEYLGHALARPHVPHGGRNGGLHVAHPPDVIRAEP